jgi:hypothetical protein
LAAQFRAACTDDVDELLTLYRAVYGSSYTLPLGTDREVMAREIESPTTTWLVARQHARGPLSASILGTVSPQERLGKLQGLAVHPDARGAGMAGQAVRELSDRLLDERQVDSVYATARTNSTAPQRICLQNGFRALGVFPNLRKSDRHETMVLLARHRPGVLERRLAVPRVPAGLGGLVDALHQAVGQAEASRPRVDQRPVSASSEQGAAPDPEAPSFEVVDAPAFVRRRLATAVPDPADRFYPFHSPNVLLSAADGGFEVYAQLNRSDGYCALVATAPGLAERGGDLDAVISALSDQGALHIEMLLPLDHYANLDLLLGNGFLPAAAYPAMRREGAGYRDYVVMARSMKPLDFRGLAIDAAFRPFTEQYIELWKHQYLNTHGIFH